MDTRKLLSFLKRTDEDLDVQERQRRYDLELNEQGKILEKNKSLVSSMVKGGGWKLIEEWKAAERLNLLNRIYKEVRAGDLKKAERTATEIEALNKLFASIINIIGPSK